MGLSFHVYRIPAGQARETVSAIFKACGFPKDHAEIITDNLIFADLRGVSTHGLSRVGAYCERAQKKFCNIRPDIRVLRESPAAILLDGDNGFGAVVGTKAMELTIQKAKTAGSAVCSVQNSSHFGAAAYFTMMAARHGMIGFSCTNVQPNMAPYGSRTPMLGTNPFSIAVPSGGKDPVVLDIATSIVARGNILNAAKEHAPIPEGWALDAEGISTTDAVRALDGCILPFGGHKGSGIAVMIDILCGILSGSEYGSHVRQLNEKEMGDHHGPGIGHFFAAVDVGAFLAPSVFLSRVGQQIEELKAAPRAKDVEEIFVPGELEARKEKENEKKGIWLSAGTMETLCRLSSQFQTGIDPLSLAVQT